MKKYLLLGIAFIACNTTAYSDNTLNIDIKDYLKIELIKCPSGEFLAGSSPNETGYMAQNDMPRVKMVIDKEFYIGKYETTQALYQEVMSENPSKNKGNDLPVERVTYTKAMEFCQKLNELTKAQRPAGFEFMLPTEKQWEYACRAGTNTALNDGSNLTNTNAKCENLNSLAWYKHNSETQTHPVGQKKPNKWGIYDMHGNVAEWCYTPEAKITDEKSCSILRGGAYFYEPQKTRSASRGASFINSVSSGFGFRVALINTGKIEKTVEETSKTPTNETTETTKEDNASSAVNPPEKPQEALQNIQSEPVTTAERVSNTVPATTSVVVATPTQAPLVQLPPMEEPKAMTATSTTTTAIPTTNKVSEQKPIKAGEKISVAYNGVKFPLIGCPPGKFIMGSPSDEPCHSAIEEQHEVVIEKGFYIGKYEITQGQYKAIMGHNPSIETGDKLPVHNINWLDAQKFCEKLNELTKDKRPANSIFVLPTEAQWEYACRSGYKTSLNNGKNLVDFNSSDQELNKLAWNKANACNKVQTVGKKIANAWGIHDMHGNVQEWCQDLIKEVPVEGNMLAIRALRGGSYLSVGKECRSAHSLRTHESDTQTDYGLRIILIQK